MTPHGSGPTEKTKMTMQHCQCSEVAVSVDAETCFCARSSLPMPNRRCPVMLTAIFNPGWGIFADLLKLRFWLPRRLPFSALTFRIATLTVRSRDVWTVEQTSKREESIPTVSPTIYNPLRATKIKPLPSSVHLFSARHRQPGMFRATRNEYRGAAGSRPQLFLSLILLSPTFIITDLTRFARTGGSSSKVLLGFAPPTNGQCNFQVPPDHHRCAAATVNSARELNFHLTMHSYIISLYPTYRPPRLYSGHRGSLLLFCLETNMDPWAKVKLDSDRPDHYFGSLAPPLFLRTCGRQTNFATPRGSIPCNVTGIPRVYPSQMYKLTEPSPRRGLAAIHGSPMSSLLKIVLIWLVGYVLAVIASSSS
ncbi:hypothetical protein B0H19DRAFT_1079412 [Mycena capillaripes]|nr:hypothetical protein B0H19DRAFT_1079412 [Mycena capillaripes]